MKEDLFKASHLNTPKRVQSGTLRFSFELQNRDRRVTHEFFPHLEILDKWSLQELEVSFKAFDQDESGEVDYDEFLLRLRSDCMNEKRQSVSY